MRKIFTIIVLLSVSLSFTVSAADIIDGSRCDDVITSTDIYMNDEINEISREDCLITVMKLMGVDEESACRIAACTWYDSPIFCDMNIFTDLSHGMMAKGYIIIAYENNIVKGVPVYSNDKGEFEYYFQPKRGVTLREYVAFLVRCIEGTEEPNGAI